MASRMPAVVYGSFCDFCKHILDWEAEPSFFKHWFQHHSNIFDLKLSADGGCRLCRRIYDSIPAADLSSWLALTSIEDGPSKEEQEIRCKLKVFLGDMYSMSFTCDALSRFRAPEFCGFMWELVMRDQDALGPSTEVQNMLSNASSDLLPKLYGMPLNTHRISF
jgi:hypothetical protein